MSDPTPPRPDDGSEPPPGDTPGDTPGGDPAAIPETGLGPPPGQDGSPAPPSEFLTPVRPYETIEPEIAGPSTAASGGGARRRPAGAIVAAVVVVVLVAAAIVVAATAQRDSGPPGGPEDVVASARVCAAPECERIEAIVTLSWSPPDGEVERYVVERDGGQILRLPASSTGLEVDGLQIDRSYRFGVRAVGSGTTGPVVEVRVRTPTPPLEQAQLTGTYRVRETVRRSTNLAAVEGIEHPRPGSAARNTWSFDAICADQAGACPTNWFTWGPLQDRGTRYDGTFRARPASCGSGGTTPTTTEMHLTIAHAETVEGRWIADRFRGTMRVSFRCPGGRSLGVLAVDGRARGA